MRDELEDAGEKREGTACLLPVFIYISQHFQLVAVWLQGGQERDKEKGGEREVCFRSPWSGNVSL